ncbi:hypothetical protein P3X46_008454 [Hevea brasiliensis]|uniref:DCD domain-containing protein n=2 Tax=Hevea brasiliensis TaxID=3981 RepID=A0ABQ9ML31_HEVBR|nr:hypothetical protein P3X46_008454 [Hevea brasiliensis]
MEQMNSNKDAENLAEASSKSLLSGKNNVEAENAGEMPDKAESSHKRTPKSLKAKSNIKKKSLASSSFKATKALGDRRRNRRRKNKSVVQENKESNKNGNKNDQNQNSRVGKLQKNGANEEHTGRGIETQKSQARIAGSSRSQHSQRNDEKQGGPDKSSRSQKDKGKLDEEKNKGDERKKEKLGGLIFMCNAKTKPDCFHYRVMGVTASKKDVVLGVKPGLKLFLYDFDLKLMYGIYKASSSGGMKLEPKAFGGSFPVQVRFGIHKDCFPLPESVFKKAIKDNYDEKNKFKIELTVQQVRKLSALFRPAVYQSVPSAAVPFHSPSMATIRDREAYEGVRESRPHSDRETFTRVNGDGRSYPVVSRERDQHIELRELVSSYREEAPRDLYMSEKEYRTYGLQRERRNMTSPHGAAGTLDPYKRDLEGEHLLRQPAPLYNSDTIPLHRESFLADPHYLSQRELQTYNLGGRSELPPVAASSSAVPALDSYSRDPSYSYRYGAPSVNAYLLPPRREEISSGAYNVNGRRETYLADADHLRRRDTDEVDNLYLKYAVDPPSDYNQARQAVQPENLSRPVSSRYAFAGSSLSYR